MTPLFFAMGLSLAAGCAVDTNFFDGLPCDPQGRCASGYSCVREACGEGYLCPVCRRTSPVDDGGLDGADGADGADGTDVPTDDGATSCSESPPACKALDTCTDVAPACVDGAWVCDTGFELPELSCDGRDNDCDGAIDVGLVCPLAGSGTPGLADGTGSVALFQRPRALLALPDGKLVVADQGNHAIRTVTGDGVTATLVGKGQGGFQDGALSDALFREPSGLALEADGALLVADRGNHRIRRIGTDGQVTTLAGSGFVDFQDGPALEAKFAFPTGLAIQGGSVFVADSGNHCIRSIAAGEVSTFAGRCGYPGVADGKAEARFNSPTDLALLPDGNLVVSEEAGNRLRLVAPDGSVSTLAGDGQAGFADGQASTARFKSPTGITSAPDNAILLADAGNHRIRAIALGQVTTRIGSGTPGLRDGPPLLVELRMPSGIAYLQDGRLVIADTQNHMLRVANP